LYFFLVSVLILRRCFAEERVSEEPDEKVMLQTDQMKEKNGRMSYEIPFEGTMINNRGELVVTILEI
jgi:hypothetical protein